LRLTVSLLLKESEMPIDPTEMLANAVRKIATDPAEALSLMKTLATGMETNPELLPDDIWWGAIADAADEAGDLPSLSREQLLGHLARKAARAAYEAKPVTPTVTVEAALDRLLTAVADVREREGKTALLRLPFGEVLAALDAPSEVSAYSGAGPQWWHELRLYCLGQHQARMPAKTFKQWRAERRIPIVVDNSTTMGVMAMVTEGCVVFSVATAGHRDALLKSGVFFDRIVVREQSTNEV